MDFFARRNIARNSERKFRETRTVLGNRIPSAS
jgi:hypothetical protein